ncbi:MAG: phenylalanine--tRNA ligase subunit beta [Actinomycetota bacterium]
MRVSLKWLEEFVAVDVPVDKLADQLSMSGTKVEAVHRPGGSVGGVVVAEVVDISEHPNADNLILVEVKTQDGATQRVVCGAHNFSVGDRVPYATVGARLGEFAISERKIRGQASAGMLCSPAELGISKDHSGILVLSPDADLGADIVPLLGLDDTILELEITPNRPDCMGMIGIAREVSTLLRNELKIPDAGVSVAEDLASPVTVDIQDSYGCPRYLARYIDGVQVGPSPSWMAARLLAAGVRPISNVVDATNYVMLETGQPLHAFDAAKVAGHKIVVRRAKRNEPFVALDGVTRELHPDDLMIADPRRALAIAGVIGGEESEVSADTNDVILESAHFDPVSIAFTSRRHVVRTEASARFERGSDPEVVPYAAARAAQMIAETSAGRVSGAVVDAYPRRFEPRSITLRPGRTDALLGYRIPPAAQGDHLRSIGFTATEEQRSLLIEVPSFRPDVVREEDLIEEVARLAGFERLPSTLPPGQAGRLEPEQRADRRMRRALAGFGLHESWTGSFMSPVDLDSLRLASDHAARRTVKLANPMSEDEDVLRTTLLPGLLRAVARNLAQRAEGVDLYEIARVYEHTGEELPREAAVLGILVSGLRQRASWIGPARPWDFFAVKGIVEALCRTLEVPAPSFAPVAGMPFHPTRAARVSIGDVTAGVVGELHPDVCAAFDVAEGSVAAELAVAPLIAALPTRVRVGELPRFPAVYIDLAVVVDEDLAAAAVADVIREAGEPELTSVRLFDLYRGEQVPEGKKSLAFALELRVPDRTMTDEDATVVRDRIVQALRERMGAELRGGA